MIFLAGCGQAQPSKNAYIYDTLSGSYGNIECIEGVQYFVGAMNSHSQVATLLVDKNGKPLTCPWSNAK